MPMNISFYLPEHPTLMGQQMILHGPSIGFISKEACPLFFHTKLISNGDKTGNTFTNKQPDRYV